VTPAAVAVIRAKALRENLKRVRELAPGFRVLAVIKANAYGHGLVAVARILDDADAFAVARLEEAMELRHAGITKRVVVLGSFVGADEAAACVQWRLDCVIHSLEQVQVLERLAKQPSADLWIKVDTGMGRLGIEPEALPEVRRRLERCTGDRSRLKLMSHLARADEPDAAGTSFQLACFERLSEGWAGDVSMANSAAILQGRLPRAPSGAEAWVRPGLMLYGVSPLAGISSRSLGLCPAMSFETRLIAVRRLPRGRHVGYGGEWQATRNSIVGVAAAGYADGYPWHLPRGTPVVVNGIAAPVIGRVSMDMISIDLTDVSECRAGDRVVLWGDDPPVETVAAHAGTISYELLAAMSPRVIRRLDDELAEPARSQPGDC